MLSASDTLVRLFRYSLRKNQTAGEKRWALPFVGHIFYIRRMRLVKLRYYNMEIKTEYLYVSEWLCITGKAGLYK